MTRMFGFWPCPAVTGAAKHADRTPSANTRTDLEMTLDVRFMVILLSKEFSPYPWQVTPGDSRRGSYSGRRPAAGRESGRQHGRNGQPAGGETAAGQGRNESPQMIALATMIHCRDLSVHESLFPDQTVTTVSSSKGATT